MSRYRPMVLPAGWREVQERDDGMAYRHHSGMTAISSVEEHAGRLWLHVSCARPDRLPSWEDLKDVKAAFIGRQLSAYQVLPAEAKYVNIHPFCLHLFAVVDEGPDPLPDFTGGSGSL